MNSSADSIRAIVEGSHPQLQTYESLYKTLHANPELSHQESESAALILKHLISLSSDFDIRTHIGGNGLIAILKNGAGETVLLRADMDALPVKEMTGLDYASHKQATDIHGEVQHVMHACGHDVHVVCLLLAAEMLLKVRESWAGTLVFLFQPAEEHGDGAHKMVTDGLFDPQRHACPRPDILLGQHVAPIPAGVVGAQAGTVMNSSDALKITVFGRGGHGSMPHRCIDPVVIAAHIIVRLQTIVSREVSPDDVAVITVGSVHAGEKENVIPEQAVFKISIRANAEDVRKQVIESIQRIVESECSIARCEKPPSIEHILSLPVTRNAVAVDNRLKPGFENFFSGRFLGKEKGALASEDFSVLATSIDKPYYFWFFGGISQEQWDEKAKANELDKIPINHSPFFAPAIHPTLQTGADALVVATLTYLLDKAAT